jgi:hypothetical protein
MCRECGLYGVVDDFCDWNEKQVFLPPSYHLIANEVDTATSVACMPLIVSPAAFADNHGVQTVKHHSVQGLCTRRGQAHTG